MKSVTQRIREVKQPRGGYINPRIFEQQAIDDNVELNPEENIHASLIGLAVDYMSRFILGTPVEEAFRISFYGAQIINKESVAMELAKRIVGIDNESIRSACKLVGFDVCFRSNVTGYRPVETINPDDKTIENIIILINRSKVFFDDYGPIIKDGFTFEGGYTRIVSTGDGDFLTKDTLWDFKVSKAKPTSKHTLQLLMYYLMGKKSIHKDFDSVSKIGIYNPRLNIVYLLNLSDIEEESIKIVSKEIIGY